MSWKRIARPDALPQGLDTARRDAAARLAEFYTGGEPRGELGDRLDFLVGRGSRSAAQMVSDIGGIKAVADATGASERTVRDWRRGAHSPSAAHQEALEKAARKSTVTALGGTKAVADVTGRATSTVYNWVNKPTQAKGDAAHRLNIAEVKDRHARARNRAGQSVGENLVLKVKGHVRVKATTQTPSYEVDRDAWLELSPEVQDAVADAVARGDSSAVHSIIEQSATTDYVNLGGELYDGRQFGFFLDRVDQTEMKTRQSR